MPYSYEHYRGEKEERDSEYPLQGRYKRGSPIRLIREIRVRNLNRVAHRDIHRISTYYFLHLNILNPLAGRCPCPVSNLREPERVTLVVPVNSNGSDLLQCVQHHKALHFRTVPQLHTLNVQLLALRDRRATRAAAA